MAGSGWNSRHANMQGRLNHARQQPPDLPIACRVCNDIFMSHKELLDHFELHQVLAEAADVRQALLTRIMGSQKENPPTANRLRQKSPMISTPAYQPRQTLFQNNIASASSSKQPLFTQRKPTDFSFGTNTRSLDLLRPAAPPTPISFPSRNIRMPPVQTQQQATTPGGNQVVIIDSRNLCFTRPFLAQLEAKLLVDGMASMVDKAMGPNEPKDGKMLDLTLRLGRGNEDQEMEDQVMEDQE